MGVKVGKMYATSFQGRSRYINGGSIPPTSTMSKQQQTITKQLQNLYSWTQFYQERGNKEQIRKCQTQIAALKKAYNETKTKK